MKKITTLLSLSLFLFFACKKEEPKEFAATDVTGSTVMKGNITKNVILPDGLGNWTSSGKASAKDVQVSIKINKSSLYPNSSAQGADVYSGITDDKGNYNISVKSNASGVIAQITVEGFTSTLDTLMNGTLKKGLLANYTGTAFTSTLYMGQSFVYNYGFTASPVSSNPNTLPIGNAIITGSVGQSIVKEIMTGTIVSLTTAFVPLSNQKVFLSLNKDPKLLQQKLYEITTDTDGRYSFTVETVSSGNTGFSQSATLWVTDRAATRDTLKIDNTIKTGRTGVYSMKSINLTGVYSDQIRNANYLNYTNFTPN